MIFRFTLNRKKRRVLLVSALIFLFQSIAPGFASLQAQTVDGYTDTICTMYGPKTVFVTFEQEAPVEKPSCFECSVCLLQANLNGADEPAYSVLTAFFAPLPVSAGTPDSEPVPVAPFNAFASRAPPR